MKAQDWHPLIKLIAGLLAILAAVLITNTILYL